jgi:hypothetical protein
VSAQLCPEGHASTATDWCDVCGAPMVASANGAGPPPPPAPAVDPPTAPNPSLATRPCPSCSTPASADALFCESCGYDFTTGALPPDPPPPDAVSIELNPTPSPPSGPVTWVAEVWVDPDWYAAQESDDPCPSAGAPVVVPLRERSNLIGRTSVSRSIHPQIECASDTGVSRRHAQLTTDGQRWWVEDLQSANGTYVGSAGGELPSDAVPPGQRRELAEDERLYVGAWTRIVVRAATPEEQSA